MFSLRCQGGQCVSAIDFNKSSPKESELRDKKHTSCVCWSTVYMILSGLHTNLHDSHHLHQGDELRRHAVAQPSHQLRQQSFEGPELLQLLNKGSAVHLTGLESPLNSSHLTSVKCSTQEQKAEEELRSVWMKPRLRWNFSATLHRFVSFSNVKSTRAKYIRFTTSMSTSWTPNNKQPLKFCHIATLSTASYESSEAYPTFFTVCPATCLTTKLSGTPIAADILCSAGDSSENCKNKKITKW